MAKPKKKRTKRYSGSDAATTQPTIHRISAVDRGALGQWWFEKKRLVKVGAITSGVVLILSWLLLEIIRLLSQ